MWLLTWLNVSVATLNAMFQLLVLYRFLASRGASMAYYLLVAIHIDCIIKCIGTNELCMIILFSWYDTSISLVINLVFDG